MAKYDDASWHYGGDYPEDLPAKNAANHIGMFLAWCINNDLLSEEQLEEFVDEVTLVKARAMTGAEFLIAACDEKFTDEDLNKIGNAFAKAYYEYVKLSKFAKTCNHYIGDYSRILNGGKEDNVYVVEDTWQNYDLLSPIIDQRFREWKEFSSKKK